MKVLNCENEHSMFESIREIAGIRKNEMVEMFNQFNLEDFYECNPDFHLSPDKLFLVKLKEMSNRSSLDFDKTNWFHLTRTIPTNQFEKGILPLGESLDYLWDLLFALQNGFLSLHDWKQFRFFIESKSSYDAAFQYQLKYKDEFYWGPYAMLIREVAFYPKEISNHDYLDVPEIIEDICYPFHEKYGLDLLSMFKEETVPCIVKFETNISDEDHMGIVVNYLYHRHHNVELSFQCNTTFDGKGKAIPRENILGFEFVKVK